MKPNRRPQKQLGFGRRMILTTAISLVILTILSGLVVSQDTPGFAEDTEIFFQSRYILWDVTEKMIDPIFNITIISFDNNSHNYNILVGNKTYSGNYTNIITTQVTYNYSRIEELIISVDNQTLMSIRNIRVIGGVTADKITEYVEPFKFEFLPVELTKFEWNLVYSGIVGAIVCLPTAYFAVKYYRKRRGPVEV